MTEGTPPVWINRMTISLLLFQFELFQTKVRGFNATGFLPDAQVQHSRLDVAVCRVLEECLFKSVVVALDTPLRLENACPGQGSHQPNADNRHISAASQVADDVGGGLRADSSQPPEVLPQVERILGRGF